MRSAAPSRRDPEDPAEQATVVATAETIHLDTVGDEAGAHGAGEHTVALPASYRLGPLLGEGSTAQVFRAQDLRLDRDVALKLLRSEVAGSASARRRFLAEARATAGLQHPGIVPVHELGELNDGRPFFTMGEVRGRELGDIIAAVHAASGEGRWEQTEDGWTLRRLVEVFRRVCETVDYAHGHGVVHRDLKPQNLLVGDHAEVLVVDWGLAWKVDVQGAARPGAVAGTPAYMAPEQARGELAEIGPWTDVFALGGVLWTILSGRAPYQGSFEEVLAQAREGRPAALQRARRGDGLLPEVHIDGAPAAVPAELVELCRAALQPDATARPSDAGALAKAATAWLEGVRKRRDALDLVERAVTMDEETRALRRRVDETRARAGALLSEVSPFAPEAERHGAWALQDAASALEREAALRDVRAEQLLRGALSLVPELPEANLALAWRLQRAHLQAERAGDETASSRSLALLNARIRALPEGHADRELLSAWVEGDGELSLITSPPGARLDLYRYVARHRRMVLEHVRALPRSPVRGLPIQRGSYVVRIRAEGRQDVDYPVFIGRGERWDGVPPDGSEPFPIPVPAVGSLGADERYVPAGWFQSGGDAGASNSLPSHRIWVDGFVVCRFPVINTEYIAFLDALVRRGRSDLALAYAPRERGGTQDEQGALIYGRDADGFFVLRPDADGDEWHPSNPVMNVDWLGARAYARWRARETGRPWRLLSEVEWEKAARGVDGRIFPWGDWFDSSRCCMRFNRAERAIPQPVGSFPVDCSPYGVMDMAGDAREWCRDRYRQRGPTVTGGRLDLRAPVVGSISERMVRGGSWASNPEGARCCTRERFPTDSRYGHLGFRVGYSLSGLGPNPSPLDPD